MKLSALAILLFFSACQVKEANELIIEERSDFSTDSEDFSEYWYSGKAELASYVLEQNRYGEVRSGDAVLIFVTEPFSHDRHVKLDNADADDRVAVMKLNFTKKFQTGIYPYSMMSSTFTPVDDFNYPFTLKSTATVQEWCGQTFTQINRGTGGYFVTGFSYFESEGDTEKFLKVHMLEDELWNRIRINPDKLPVGTFNLLPGTFFERFLHYPTEIHTAKMDLKKGEEYSVYSIEYLALNRSLYIEFENSFPHRIVSWEEKQDNLTMSKGRLKQTLHTDYWSKNSSEFEYMYDSLLLN